MSQRRDRPTYHNIPFRADTLDLFREFFPVEGMAPKIYAVLLQEAITNERIQSLLKELEADWDKSERGFIGLSDRSNYNKFLELMGTTDKKSVTWNSLLLKAFLEHAWVRKVVGDRLLSI
jgi:hypothetical protein